MIMRIRTPKISQPEKLESMRPKTRSEIRERASDLLEKMDSISKECNTLIETLDQIEKKKEQERKKRKKKRKSFELRKRKSGRKKRRRKRGRNRKRGNICDVADV